MRFSAKRPMALVLPSLFNYLFCKGYYARVAQQQMTGRVSRLLVAPLIKALKKICKNQAFLDYLDSYRYPLSGEFSMRTDVCSYIRLPSDWGLEIGVLSEVQRNHSTNRLCQVDIAEIYDHKHQPLSKDVPGSGLNKMSIDIAKAQMSNEGILPNVIFNRSPSAVRNDGKRHIRGCGIKFFI